MSVASSFVETQRESLPVVPLRDMVIFPHMMAPFVVGRESSVRALEAALAGRADVHARPLADRFDTLEDGDVLRPI